MLWIALHLPRLSLETLHAALVVQAADAADAGDSSSDAFTEPPPLALTDGRQILQADGTARALGIAVGQKRATALALVPRLHLAQADASRDAEALLAVAHAALAFTPSVSLSPPQSVLLEVQASLRCFGGHERLLQRLRAALAPLGHHVRVASGPTAQGAALLARLVRGAGPSHDLHCADLDTLTRRLEAAPVWLLGPGREHWEALQGMGLRTVGDLRGLPRSGIARRFGEGLLDELDRALGRRPDPRQAITLPPSFDGRLELLVRADTTDQVLHGARMLLARLVAWAQGRQVRIVRLRLLMLHERTHRSELQSLPPSELEIALAQPSCDVAHLQLLLRERLAHLQLAAPTLELRLLCSDVAHQPAPNAELFPSPQNEREGMTRLIERLQARLGREQVQRIAYAQDHRPERASRCVTLDASRPPPPPSPPVATVDLPVVLPHRDKLPKASLQVVDAFDDDEGDGELHDGRHGRGELDGHRASDAAPDGSRSHRPSPAAIGPVPARPAAQPIWLLPEPLPLTEHDRHPLLDGRPLALLCGPERMESGWWDGALAARDYFIARADDESLVWIYRCRLPPQDDAPVWFLQGRFG